MRREFQSCSSKILVLILSFVFLIHNRMRRHIKGIFFAYRMCHVIIYKRMKLFLFSILLWFQILSLYETLNSLTDVYFGKYTEVNLNDQWYTLNLLKQSFLNSSASLYFELLKQVSRKFRNFILLMTTFIIINYI